MNIQNRILLVVGDKFASYVQGKDAITLSQLRGLLSLSIPLLSGQGVTVLVPGQGLGDANIKLLLQEAAASANLACFDFSLWHRLPERAPSSLSHKHNPANTLISSPRQIAVDMFESHLLIDEDCELMLDHLSGQHVQGMVLIEATRQALLAVTEAYLMPKNGIDYAFVFNALSVNYSHYTFPVGAIIRSVMTEMATENPRRLSFAANVFVEQCGQVVSTFTASFGAMEKLRITKREGMQATKAQSDYLTYIAANMQTWEEPLAQVENL
jgi:hypothetical protein